MKSRTNDKPDPYIAAGIAAGMGHFSDEDIISLGSLLESQGAFDDDEDDYEDGDDFLNILIDL